MHFTHNKTNPLFDKYRKSITPFARSLDNEQIELVQKKKIYSYIKEDDVYNIQSRNYAYRISTDLTKCSCQFFSNYGLPCRNLLFFFIQEN
jgi:hypothetical protein